ncbi:MAG: hypothetical protein IPO50_07315, partial [Sphingomonadales bacterium]|nr:hypothetical protein [Sphingomonadales bacterium]
WSLSDEELGVKLCDWLAGVGLPVTAKVRRTVTRRLGYAYPVYDRNFEGDLAVMDQWVESLEGLLTFGRQGSVRATIRIMPWQRRRGAVDCLNADGSFDLAKWRDYRRIFRNPVVED